MTEAQEQLRNEVLSMLWRYASESDMTIVDAVESVQQALLVLLRAHEQMDDAPEWQHG